jgi:hypothetical protein
LRYACKQNGRLAERLGRALQKLVQQFESAIDLVRNLSFHKFRLMKTFFLLFRAVLFYAVLFLHGVVFARCCFCTVSFLHGGDSGFHGGTRCFCVFLHGVVFARRNTLFLHGGTRYFCTEGAAVFTEEHVVFARRGQRFSRRKTELIPNIHSLY